MKALVTGGNGFVGKHLITHLLEEGDEVIACDRSGHSEISHPHFQYQTLDITDSENCYKLFKKFSPDCIYHLAGVAFMPEAEKNFDRVLGVNVGGVSSLMNATKRYIEDSANYIRILFVSTAQIYGKVLAKDLPLTEESLIKPDNKYSLTKYLAEQICNLHKENEKLEIVITRPFNHIGPGQNDRFVVSSFAKQLADIKKDLNEPVIEVGNLEAERDFTDVRDIVKAYRLAICKGKGVYNLCSGNSVSIQSILNKLIEISGLKVKVVEDKDRMRPSEVKSFYGSFDKAQKELAWKPNLSLEESLADVYRYWLEKAA